jgi:hypothetical protein
LSDLAGFFFLDETLVADDGFMGNGGAQIVDRSPRGKDLAGFVVVLRQGLANDLAGDMEQQRDIGLA